MSREVICDLGSGRLFRQEKSDGGFIYLSRETGNEVTVWDTTGGVTADALRAVLAAEETRLAAVARKNLPPVFVFCYPPRALPSGATRHIRQVDDVPINQVGGFRTPAMCGRIVGCDEYGTVSAERIALSRRVCPNCEAAWKAAQPRGGVHA